MARYCGNCGTEVDDTAVFCPTCGQPIDDGQSADLPAAPAWPNADPDSDPEPDPEPNPEPEPEPDTRARPSSTSGSVGADRTAAESDSWHRAGREAVDDAPTRVEQRPPADDPAVAPPIPAAPPRPVHRDRDDRAGRDATPRGSRTRRPNIDVPLTMPVTLSGWLLGIGALLAVLGLVVILVGSRLNAIDLLLLVALLGVAATIFLSARMPAIPHLRLICLVVSLIAFGVALDRVGFLGGSVGELLLFLGTAAAALGAVLLELGQDQPLGGPQR